MDILESIKMKSETLTKKQRMVAGYMLKHQDEMAYKTLKDLSRETKVTEITILNTCQSLGYEGFNDVKYEFRKAAILHQKTDVVDEKLSYSVKVPRYELNNKEKLLNEVGDEELKMLSGYWRRIKLKEIFRAVELIVKSKRVIICGRGISFAIAEFLRIGLSSCEIFSVSVNTELSDDTYGMFSGIDEEVLVIPISFPDYYFMTTKVVEYARSRNAAILAITDHTNAEVAEYADLVLTAPTMTRVQLNTLSGPMILLNLLISAIKLSQEENISDVMDCPKKVR